MHKDLRRSKLFLVLLCFLHSYYFRFCLCVPLLAHDMSHLVSSPASLSSSSQRLSHTIPSCFHSRGTWNLVALARRFGKVVAMFLDSHLPCPHHLPSHISKSSQLPTLPLNMPLWILPLTITSHLTATVLKWEEGLLFVSHFWSRLLFKALSTLLFHPHHYHLLKLVDSTVT